VVIDEPETGLHPNLIVDFMRGIKAILEAFESYAVIATHSMIVTREVPKSCVRVMSASEGLPVVREPVIETFGADITAICNEVFGDLEVDAAYEEQLRKLGKRLDSYKQFVTKHGSDLSEEALTFVLNDVFDGKRLR
jgi:leucyl-tRNA synthetase